ncbi:MAG TPA: type VI secretion system baseplate subunit TssG [Terrimicrobiaceae bacterium]
MADSTGQQTSDLIWQLAAKPFAFDFFRAVRLIECCFPEKPRIGDSLSPRDDPLRFGQVPSLAFAPSTLAGFQPGDAGRPARLSVNFLGLFGPSGPMPLHITEYARERLLNAHDPTLAAFLDVFHHRILSLFYRAWAVNQKTADMDRPKNARFPAYIGSLFGIGAESLRNRDDLPDNAKLYFSGHLACKTRNAEGLEKIIADFFGVPAKVLTFVGQWLKLPPASQCRLGESPESGTLGSTAIVGSRFWETQLKFRLRLGAMKLNDLYRMLPVGDAFRRLKCWVLNYSDQEYFWDVQLVLEAGEVPETCLGNAGLLGWTTWLKSEPFMRDAHDLVVNGG